VTRFWGKHSTDPYKIMYSAFTANNSNETRTPSSNNGITNGIATCTHMNFFSLT